MSGPAPTIKRMDGSLAADGSPSKDAHHHHQLGGSSIVDLDVPGHGWSNGQLRPEMFPITREGKLQLYSSERRWLHLATGWSRVGGKGTDQYSHRTSSSQVGKAITVDAHEEARTVRSLIAQLCEQFYRNGWATGTGGGVSIRVGGPTENRPWRVFVAPSGIQKEDMIGDDIFELDMDGKVVVAPKTPNLRQSACTPLWYVVFNNRPSVRSVIHTHSMHAQMATMLDSTETSKTLKITHLEMLKGVGNHSYDDVLEIPIIDNRPSEDLLAQQLEEVINKYPKANCVLVRRHGLYVWGDSYEQAKTQCEAFDYLFQSAVEMKKLGMDPGMKPFTGSYRVEASDSDEPHPKRIKTGFNGVGQVDNTDDLSSNLVPILPRDSKHLLLDIEGCTTSISFVKDTLFPFVLQHLDKYLSELSTSDYNDLTVSLSQDLTADQQKEVVLTDAASMVRFMVTNDLKLSSLKSMQGAMWKSGYESGSLQGHVYPDFSLMLNWMKEQRVHVHIYSSGSVQAQKLLFGHSVQGNLCEFFDHHFDIKTSGNKKAASSYENIAKSLGVSPSEIVFCSDLEAELEAAKEAGIGHAVMSVRPGNAPLSDPAKALYPQIFSLLQLCGV